MITIRHEQPADAAAVRRVLMAAFGRDTEANLVEALRARGACALSLVAVEDDQVVGHIWFSSVAVESEASGFDALALGPMAVLPSHQRRGIGSQLVHVGLEDCRRAGHEIVVVLGHPWFYPRFGFAPARPRGVRWKHDIPDEVFMLVELRDGALSGRSGVVKYQPEFASVQVRRLRHITTSGSYTLFTLCSLPVGDCVLQSLPRSR